MHANVVKKKALRHFSVLFASGSKFPEYSEFVSFVLDKDSLNKNCTDIKCNDYIFTVVVMSLNHLKLVSVDFNYILVVVFELTQKFQSLDSGQT